MGGFFLAGVVSMGSWVEKFWIWIRGEEVVWGWVWREGGFGVGIIPNGRFCLEAVFSLSELPDWSSAMNFSFRANCSEIWNRELSFCGLSSNKFSFTNGVSNICLVCG